MDKKRLTITAASIGLGCISLIFLQRKLRKVLYKAVMNELLEDLKEYTKD